MSIGGLVMAQSGQTTLDDFEDGNADGWSNAGSNPDGEIVATNETVLSGDYSLLVNDSPGDGSGDTEAEFSGFNPESHQTLSVEWFDDSGTSWIYSEGDAGELFFLEYDANSESWTAASSVASDADLDLAPLGDGRTVTISFDYTNKESTVYVIDGGSVVAEDTFTWPSGSGSTQLSTFHLGTGAGEAYFDDVAVNATVPGDVSIDARNYMRPDTSQHYDIEFTPSGSNTSQVVTENATLTSSDNETLTVYESNNTIVATGNASALPATVTLTAQYEDFSGTKNVTIAKPTVENLDLLPVWWKVTATVGDGLMLWLFGAVLMAIVATRISTAFAGVGAFTMIITAGWVAGPVSNGVTVATWLMAAFLGLNLAMNIDTTIRQ